MGIRSTIGVMTGGITMSIKHRVETLWCRVFQGVLKLGNYFMGYRLPECIEGEGKLQELGAFLRQRDINDVLIVTGAGMVKRGQLQPMLSDFDQNGIRYTLKTYTATDPTSDDVERGYKVYKENGCRAIVALGGGSRIDCAKAIAAKVVRPKKSVAQLQGLLRVRRSIPPFIAIPTTSGAGSETTVAAVITNCETHRKASINDPALIPKYAVLDPKLTAPLPPYTTAITGMDALAHAVEAYTNKTYNTRLENELARNAVRLIYNNILITFENGSNLEARQNMQKAAFYAGRAFTRGCVGYVHAIGHTLGSLYGIEHGLAMAVLLPRVMRKYGTAVHKRLAELSDVCGIQGTTDAEKADAFIRWIEETNKKMGLPDKLDMIQDKDIAQMIAWARKEANPLYPVPVVWGEQDFREIIENVRG